MKKELEGGEGREAAEGQAKTGGGHENPAPEQAVDTTGTERTRQDNKTGGSRERKPGASSKQGLDPKQRGRFVKAINTELCKLKKGEWKIGEIVDRAVGPTGRAGYGEGVIASLAADPDLMCTYECLRRYWHYYRLMRDHGGTLGSEFPELKYAHLAQLSRLLQLEVEFGADVVNQAIHAMARHAMDHGMDGKPMRTDALAAAVTTHLKSIKGRGPDHEADPREASDEESTEHDALEDAHTALSDSVGAIQEAAERIAGSGEYIHACRLQTDIDRISQAHIALLGHIVRHDPQSLVITMARKRIVTLAGLVGLKLVEAAAANGNEVSK